MPKLMHIQIKYRFISIYHKKTAIVGTMTVERGGEENRTPVQTYSSKAFYMFILFWFVGKQLVRRTPSEKPATDYFLSWIVLSNRHSLLLQHLVLFWVGGGAWKQANRPGGPNDYLITD